MARQCCSGQADFQRRILPGGRHTTTAGPRQHGSNAGKHLPHARMVVSAHRPMNSTRRPHSFATSPAVQIYRNEQGRGGSRSGSEARRFASTSPARSMRSLTGQPATCSPPVAHVQCAQWKNFKGLTFTGNETSWATQTGAVNEITLATGAS